MSKPTWTRVTYEIVEEIIASLGAGQPALRQQCAEQAAALFEADNSHFDRARFLAGCDCTHERSPMSEPQPILISCNRCERTQRILATPERAAGGYPCRCGGRLYPPPAERPCEACGRDVAGRFHVQLRAGSDRGLPVGPTFYLCGYRCAREYIDRTLRAMEEREGWENLHELQAMTDEDAELWAQIGRLRAERAELQERDSDLPGDQRELLARLEAIQGTRLEAIRAARRQPPEPDDDPPTREDEEAQAQREAWAVDDALLAPPPALRGTEPEHVWRHSGPVDDAGYYAGLCLNCSQPWEAHDEATGECPPRPCSCEGRGEIELPSGQAAPCPYCRPAAAREWSQSQPMPLIGYDPAEDADSELVPNPPEEDPPSVSPTHGASPGS